MDRTNKARQVQKTNKIPELLAPAGNLSTAITAYESGADAVYCGLPRFNAREMGKNFSAHELSQLAGYAHKHDKSFYITFNTLLKEQELEAAVGDLQQISSLDPHGVIVQDLGAVHILRELFPSLPIHASTQMGIHNSAGVKTAARMGIERVILERQVTMDELQQIVSVSPIEVEVFVHGALCCSLSGRCLFSSWIGGWSGNRGKCKQPCRRRYYTKEKGPGKAGFFFSTQDLYSLDLLGQLAAMGVASVKIEGRLKKPDYVQSVVSAYRMVLDSIAAGERPDIKGAKAVLAESYGRKWSHGFATTEDMQTVISADNIGVSGMRIGSVAGNTPRGLLADVRKRLRVGDRVRVQPASGGEGPSFTIRRLLQGGKAVKVVSAGKVEIPVDAELPREGFLYRIGTSRKIPGPKAEALQPYVAPRRIDLQITLDTRGIRISAKEQQRGFCFSWSQELQVEAARSRALDAETVQEMFTATRAEELAAGEISVQVEDNIFVPLSLLKQARRAFWDTLLSELPSPGEEASRMQTPKQLIASLAAEHSVSQTHNSDGRTDEQSLKQTGVLCAVEGGEQLPESCDGAVEWISDSVGVGREAELPHFLAESVLSELRSTIRKLRQKSSETAHEFVFRVTDLSHIALLAEAGINSFVCGYPLPVTNSLAAKELQSLGAARTQAWIELDQEAMKAFIEASALPVEVFAYGRPFLLATRARVPVEGWIVDGRGKEFEIIYDKSKGLTYLYPPEVMKIEPPAGETIYRDLRRLPSETPEESSFNYEVDFV